MSQQRRLSDQEVETLLSASRPLPRASFRGDLRRSLLADGGQEQPPGRLRLVIAAYAASGGLLLAAVALGVAGVGPLAAG